MKVEEVSLLKRIFALFLAFSLLLFPVLAADDADTTDVAGPAFTVSAKSLRTVASARRIWYRSAKRLPPRAGARSTSLRARR